MVAVQKDAKGLEKYIQNVRFYLEYTFGCTPNHIWAEQDGWVVVQLDYYDQGLAKALYLGRDLYIHELLIEEFPNSMGGIGMTIRIWIKANMPLFYRIIYSVPYIRDIARLL